MPELPDLVEQLTDGYVALRPAAERDIPEILIAHQDDPTMYVRFGAERPPSGAELGRRQEEAEQERRDGVGISLTVVEPDADVCRGRVNLHRVDWDHLRAELGVWLAPQVRGRGYGRRSLRLTSAWLFDRTELERLAILTETDNEPMLAAARAAGFSYEGVLRGYTLERGARVDCAILSRLRADPDSP